MAIIGTFTKDETGFCGIIRTLAFTGHVTIEPVSAKRGEKSPDYRVFLQSNGTGEIGAGWERTTDGSSYLSVRIDDPSFPAPINCRLVKDGTDRGHNLIWERDRNR